MNIDRAALMQAFLSEAEEELAQFEEGVLALEERPDDPGTVEAIFRTAHTLKGNASVLALDVFSAVSHALEDVLHVVRARRMAVTAELTTMLLRGVDDLRAMLVGLREGRSEERASHEELIAALEACAAEVRAAVDPIAQDDDGAATPPARPDAGEPEARWEPVLRVEIAKLDHLLGLAARTSVVEGQIGALLLPLASTQPDLWELQEKRQRLLMELQDWVMDARMVPVGTFFRAHGRTVRDAARSRRKRARLCMKGEHVRVDTRVGDSVRDALTHLVRNAVDHGIEPPAIRAAHGKSAEGTITLQASQNGNQVVIQVSDDGAGFSVEKIRARARALGRSNAESLSLDALYRLTFEPGFSTAEEVTDLSGRGVGMDVVLRRVEALHGTVDIHSTEGVGTTVELRLPLTVSVIEGFWVEVAGTDYVLPLDDVLECLELPREPSRLGDHEGLIDLRGEPLPFYRLRQLFGAAAQRPANEQVVVVRHEQGRVGLAVDALQGQRQTVIKPLGRLFRAVAGVSGSTIRPDGRVALVIDVTRLLRSAIRRVPGRSPGSAEAVVGP